MSDRTPFRSLTLAAMTLVALGGCGRTKDESTPAPVLAATPPSPVAVESPASPPAPAPSTEKPLEVKKAPVPSLVPPGVDPKQPIATVNGRPILANKVYAAYRMNEQMLKQRGRELNPRHDRTLRAQSLEVVIADELLYQAALAKGITATEADIEGTLKQLKARLGSEATYRQFLAESGLTESELRSEVTRNLQTDAYGKGLLAGRAVSEEQAKKFYDANASTGMFNVPEQVHVQIILLKALEKDPASVRLEAKKRAEEAAKRAAAGEDFSALAKQYSQDASAARGGDIGFFPRGVMFPEFEEVAFSGKPGEITPIFETPSGFNVMKVLEKRPESTRTYEEVKDALLADLGRVMQQDALKAKVQELAAAAKIAVLDPAFTMPSPGSDAPVAGKP